MRETFPEYTDLLELVVIPDITAPYALNETVHDAIAVIYTASRFVVHVDDNERDLLRLAIESHRQYPSISQQVRPAIETSGDHFIFYGDSRPENGHATGITYNESDWSPLTYEEAAKPDTSSSFAYAAPKALAEKAAWDFMDTNKLSFDLVTIRPPMVYEANKNASVDLQNPNTSSEHIYNLIGPESTPNDAIPQQASWSWVDVRDGALAHLRAFETPRRVVTDSSCAEETSVSSRWRIFCGRNYPS